MAISIDWATKIISIPKADTTLLQLNPIEIRELDLDAFRLALKSLEDSREGMPFLDTHRHNTTVTIGGVTLARVIEIINGFTITFENGAYAVNLAGANSNVGDVLNLNTVQVRSANSAGLIQTREIEHASFEGAVHLDVTNGVAGTVYPIGTPGDPVNNLADMLLIRAVRGFQRVHVMGNLTIPSGDYTNLIFEGQTPEKTTLTVDAAAIMVGCEFEQALLVGTLDGASRIEHCWLGAVTFVSATVHDSILITTSPVVLSGGDDVFFLDCYSGIAGSGTPVIDMGGSGQRLQMRNYTGGIKLINKTGADKVSIDLNSGHVILDATVTAGEILIRGVGKLTDNSGPGATVDAEDLDSAESRLNAATQGIR